ncbi:MAG: sugar kinase [Rhizobiaceae bacterium]
MSPQKRFLSIGECMVELSGGEGMQFKLGFAGDTLNTAWYARASLPEAWDVAYYTALGDDRYSNAMLDFLSQGGINTELIRIMPGKRPGLYIIHQENGDRHFTYWRETSAARHLADEPEHLLQATANADAIYISGITLAILKPSRRDDLLTVLEGASQGGTLIAFDPNIRPALWQSQDELRQTIKDAASIADIVLPTHGDEVPLFGDANSEETLTRYLSYGAKEVVVKDGANPVHISTGRNSLFVSTEDVETVIDATGAGDSFNGAYIAARLLNQDPAPAARAGNRMAARVIGHKGALI